MANEIEGLRELTADLARIASRALPDVDAILKKGADNIKADMVADAAGSAHFGAMAPSISYDSAYRLGQPAYEIGPDKGRGKAGRAASLANIAYFGGANGGGGTLDIDAPLKAEEPRLMKALDDFLGGL
ncbi:hypothetical protein [Cellulomonas denverensis]|uniref:hypothetical protein n=1 Tax=Cellulomonas denverensis TaxID=264297 RepID=UPI001EF2B859|nr:hypothetical protein [Cellulomonas denverensis]